MAGAEMRLALATDNRYIGRRMALTGADQFERCALATLCST
jgi:hypothetical protein